mmetsp:Transcript_26556/g.57614  ORF Transcript_26556/g.57614 Transcript_26556/m.57614 type:complete len:381 (-) Transcript_26556:186-1328(-)
MVAEVMHIRRRYFVAVVFTIAGLFLVGLQIWHIGTVHNNHRIPSLHVVAAGELPHTSEAEPETTANRTRPTLALSYSLYGPKPKYGVGMINVVTRMPKTFPGWQVWIYHDNTVARDVMRVLSRPQLRHVKLVNVEKEFPPWVHRELNPMTWRFLIASDQRVDAFAIRDSDSLPSARERAAVDEWLRSGKAFHIIRDHMMHNPKDFAPILGGMWGGLHRAVPHMDQLLRRHYSKQKVGKKKYADDQDFLWQTIMPLAYNDCLQHDSYYCHESNAIAFPISREDAGEPLVYVGNFFASSNSATADSRLEQKEYVDKYASCLEARRRIEEEMKMEGLDLASNINTTFIGKVTGSSTEAWGAWKKEVFGRPKVKVTKTIFNKTK